MSNAVLGISKHTEIKEDSDPIAIGVIDTDNRVIKTNMKNIGPRFAIVQLIFLMAVLLLNSSVSGQETEDEKQNIWEAKAPSRIRLHANESATIENHNFFYNECFRPDTDIHEKYVVSQKTAWRVGRWDGHRPRLWATAYLIDAKGEQQALWSYFYSVL